ncbi:Multicopper oxidase, type 1 [Corchorus olitorius]|uniref:Laccase n=1 Tax=Corchorus olitorius TaxID=93759 RepID=A0A1R3KQE5_9ROSI|nr:Multicopper oxidase, type 1 [Corchorus olitorius]
MNPKMGLIIGVLGLIFLAALIFSRAEGATHNYYWVVKETNFTKLCTTSTILTVNGSFPGPEIHARKGDTIFVTVQNDGPYGITIHWHGVRMPRNPWSDGPEYITQCPIKSGGNFTQEINLSTEEGTLWWHAHSDWSRATVHGAIKVFPANGTSYPYDEPDEDHTIILSSWYKSNVMDVLKEALSTGGDTNASDAYTINGEPGDLYDCSNETMYSLSVEAGKTYLLRIVNCILNEEMFLAIANHNMTVVGSDGAYLKPFSTDFLFIAPGQTMDVFLTANQKASYYYMVLSPFLDTDSSYDNTTSRALIKYCGNYTTPTDQISTPTFRNISDSKAAQDFIVGLRSLGDANHPINVPQNVTKKYFMTVAVNLLACAPNATNCTVNGNNKLAASLNNNSFVTPSTALLQQYYENNFKLNGIVDKLPNKPPTRFNYTTALNMSVYTSQGTRVITLDYGDTVEIVFQGTNIGATQNHPMHLHGYSFYLLGMGSGDFDCGTDPGRFNLVDPPEVNTIAVPRKGWAAIRFLADNPGVWFMHCHFERHTIWGMSTVIIVKNGDTNETSIRPPPSCMPPCS